ncbi:Panacea domain-containing protein [Mangrovitalea sediminis]|uniref:Panacea domain-containing protein n=1 Tax=Mangrovitalea sediminis TaxID=1982043 RepID=UPI0013045C0E|nr:type II toxin-antitoxin system antitoxin SocA domain-containing protein [Mangrovitalea sediminis]
MDPNKIHAITDHIIFLHHKQNTFLSSAKVQKLLYYMQGWHLAVHDISLFEDDFEGWVRGPTIRAIHLRFEDVYSPLLTPLDLESLYFKPNKTYRPLISQDDQRHIELAFKIYRNLSTYQLEAAIIEQQPWLLSRNDLFAGEKGDTVISKDSIQRYFRDFL